MFVVQGELLNHIMGDSWNALKPAIRKRFSTTGTARYTVFRGTVSRMENTWYGRALGYLTLPLLKGALIPYIETDLPVEFRMAAEPGRPWFEKQRLYHFSKRKLINFRSRMHANEQGDAWEDVGMGIGMRLKFGEINGDLTIDSNGYFWKVAGLRLPIPNWLTPGTMYLKHINEDADRFWIRIHIIHPLFGTTFFQEGRFQLAHRTHEQEVELEANAGALANNMVKLKEGGQ